MAVALEKSCLLIKTQLDGKKYEQCSIKNGIKKIQGYRLIVDAESINLKKELNNYCWNNKKAEVPIDEHNHLLDALRYAFEELDYVGMYFE